MLHLPAFVDVRTNASFGACEGSRQLALSRNLRDRIVAPRLA
jgi:hypothetical protein